MLSASWAPKKLASLIAPAPNYAVSAFVVLMRGRESAREALEKHEKKTGDGGGAEFYFFSLFFAFPFLRVRIHVGAVAVVRRE